MTNTKAARPPAAPGGASAEVLTPYTVPAGGRLCSLGREEIPAGAAAFTDADGWVVCTGCAAHCTSCTDADCDHPRYACGPAAVIRSFPGRPESVSAARSWVAGFFPVPAAAADAALLTSELVTNAIQYSASRLPGGQVTVSVGTADGSLRVDVIDQGGIAPCPAAPRGLGQGLALVAALADASGADGCDRWFALRAGGAL